MPLQHLAFEKCQGKDVGSWAAQRCGADPNVSALLLLGGTGPPPAPHHGATKTLLTQAQPLPCSEHSHPLICSLQQPLVLLLLAR